MAQGNEKIPEPYTDIDGNGHWDDGEPYTDTNGNGHWNEIIRKRIWVYFGTGRFWSTLDRQSDPVNYFGYQNAFYGIKEPVAANGTLTYATPGALKSKLKNVTGIEITNTCFKGYIGAFP